jgi:hypothetical protein
MRRDDAGALARTAYSKSAQTISEAQGCISSKSDQGGRLRIHKEETHNARTLLTFRPDHYNRSDAPKEMMAAAELYEQRFEIQFATLTYFSKKLLSELHRAERDASDVPSNVSIASRTDKTILDDIRELSRIANRDSITLAERKRYFSALKRIYGRLPSGPSEPSRDERTLCVGIEREGRILAESMGWLPKGHNLHPHAKRVPYAGGLLIGLSDFTTLHSYSSCLIIDGAIASGATIISTIEKLRSSVPSFRIYSVHSPYEGIHAITRYGLSSGLDLRLTIGHATAGINSHFYAVDPDDPNRVVVGDLGDTISDLRNTGDLSLDPSI